MSHDYPLHSPDIVDSPEGRAYLARVVSEPIPANLMTDEELRMAVKAQQQFLAKLAEVAKGKEETLAVQARTVEVMREDTGLLREEKSKLELLRVMADHQSNQQDRELQAKQIDTSKDIFKTACDTILAYSNNHKGEAYTHMAVKSISQSAAKIAQSGSQGFATLPEFAPPPDLEARVSRALEQGMRWNSNNLRPSRPATVFRKLAEWEKDYENGRSFADLNYIAEKNYRFIESTYSRPFIAGLCTALEGASGTPPASTYLTTRFKAATEAYRGQSVTVTVIEPDAISSEDYAKALSEEIYGYTDADVVTILVDRIKRHGGVHKLTPELIRKTCTVKRLPTFIEWDSSHVTDMERFSALREGFYDHLYERFVRED
jgi:hypothetical protein